MKRLVFLATVVAAVLTLGVTSSAQDGPKITVDPATVGEAGTVEVTVTGEGFTKASIFVLPCKAAESAGALNPQGGDCNLGGLSQATPADGKFTVTIQVEVGEDGASVLASDETGAERAFAQIAIGEVELPETGSNAVPLALLAVVLVAGGAMVVSTTRRLGRI